MLQCTCMCPREPRPFFFNRFIFPTYPNVYWVSLISTGLLWSVKSLTGRWNLRLIYLIHLTEVRIRFFCISATLSLHSYKFWANWFEMFAHMDSINYSRIEDHQTHPGGLRVKRLIACSLLLKAIRCFTTDCGSLEHEGNPTKQSENLQCVLYLQILSRNTRCSSIMW